MSGKGLEAGKAFLQGVLAKITDPGAKAHAEALLADSTFVTELGGGVLGQSEVSRQLQDLATRTRELDDRQALLDEQDQNNRTYKESLDTWYGTNKDVLNVGIAAKKAGWKPGDPIPAGNPNPNAPPAGLTQEQLDERIGQERMGVLAFTRDTNLIQREHFAKFGEIIDIDPLLAHPKIREVGLIGVYNIVNKERLDKHAADAKAADEKKIRDDERQKTLASMAQMPYPSPTGAGSADTSPLAAMQANKPDALVDQATAHYNRLQAERGGAVAGA